VAFLTENALKLFELGGPGYVTKVKGITKILANYAPMLDSKKYPTF
jgi:hypothetical protein